MQSSLLSLLRSCAIAGGFLLPLAGCAGLSELQSSVSQLDQSVHTAASAETSFLTAVQAADCDSQFYTAAYKYALNPAGNFQLASYCTPIVITADQVALRTQMMSALTLYADKLQALASSADDTSLTTDSQTLASNLKEVASNGGIKLSTGTGPDIVAAVTAAFTAIAEMALDQKKYDGITDAAKNMQPHVDAIVSALQTENEFFANAVATSYETLESQLRTIVAQADGPTGRFFAITQARGLLANSAGLTIPQLATVDWNKLDLSKQISGALPLIKSANDALARGATASVAASAHDLYSRAEAARDVYTTVQAAK